MCVMMMIKNWHAGSLSLFFMSTKFVSLLFIICCMLSLCRKFVEIIIGSAYMSCILSRNAVQGLILIHFYYCSILWRLGLLL